MIEKIEETSMMKNYVVLLFTIILFLIVPSFAKASEIEVESNSLELLTEEEINILQEDVGLTLEEIKTRSPEFLRSLIEEGAKKKFITSDIITVTDGISNNKFNTIQPMYTDPQGDLKGSIQMEGEAYEVKSDKSGYKKFRIVGRWKWISTPVVTLTDAFAIGVADSAGFILPVSNNQVVQHRHEYWTGAGGWQLRDNGNHPDDFSTNGGVGCFINLRQGQLNLHNGYMEQYVYTKKSSGDATIKFEYGHQTLALSSIGFDKNGVFSVSVTTGVKKGNIAANLSW
ncbi:hypothetical protein [Ureibacillus sp. FSL K6-0165]|uniref:hypothetical protein n=1 Tax=Ureibacillus sp. FSL K6-0165 TaxID=2954606 RepID=UPI0030F60B02